MKLQLIYSMYIKDNACNDDIYKLHYYMLKKYSNIFDSIYIVFILNDNINFDIIYKLKALFIYTLSFKDLKFSIEFNDPNFREGIIYKKYVIDKLDEYDGLTFFAHTKGVTNKNGYNNLENLKLWIFSMYYLNLNWIKEVKDYIGKYSTFGDKYCYGALYFKDHRHNNVNNWFYSGSFHWLNTKKLSKYIKENKIDISPYISEENEKLMRCAELFIGSILPENNCAFHNDEHFNKLYEPFPFNGWEISYENINEIIKTYLTPWEYNDLISEYNIYNNENNE